MSTHLSLLFKNQILIQDTQKPKKLSKHMKGKTIEGLTFTTKN